MDHRIEELRDKINEFYAGKKNLGQDQEDLIAIRASAIELQKSPDLKSKERGFLRGLFRTLKEWKIVGRQVRAKTTKLRIKKVGMANAVPFFVGRFSEQESLLDWLNDPNQRVVQIIAAGGYGKTQLVNKWMRDIERDKNTKVESVFCWCFYSAVGRQPMFNEFLTEAIDFFSAKLPSRRSVRPEKRPEYLAELIADGNQIVFLDGLEALLKKPFRSECHPNEEGSEDKPGQLRSRFAQMERFLVEVLKNTKGKVVITSRQPLQEIDDEAFGASVRTVPLCGLTKLEGVEFLSNQKIVGTRKTLLEIVQSTSGHPLTLSLLSFALCWHFNGNAANFRQVIIAEQAKISESGEVDDNEVVNSYLKWLDECSQMELLRLVGFFHQRQVPIEDLRMLILSDELRDIVPNLYREAVKDGELELQSALWDLQSNMLLHGDIDQDEKNKKSSNSNIKMVFDAHPLLRDYYASELRELEEGKYWRAGQQLLFQAYSESVSAKQPNAKGDILKLYDAIGFACQAEMYEEAFGTYWFRIHHNDLAFESVNFFAWYRLGLYSLDLGVVSWFFSDPWQVFHRRVQSDLNTLQRNMLSYAAAECLNTVGLSNEAGPPIENFRSSFPRSKYARNNADVVSEVIGWDSERRLIQGDFAKALKHGKKALEWAQKSGESRQELSIHGRLADIAMQRGDWVSCQKHFEAVLNLHIAQGGQKSEAIGGTTGFLYGEFLLTRAEIVLAGWGNKSLSLGFSGSDWQKQAAKELEAVVKDAWEILGSNEIILFDKVIYQFLGLRAAGIRNICLGSSDFEAHVKLAKELADLEPKFAEIARGELPRLLIKRSKVERRLGVMSPNPSYKSRSFRRAHECLDNASNIAAHGKLRLFATDVSLERAKVFLTESRMEGVSKSETDRLIKNAKNVCERASSEIRAMGYNKRIPELNSIEGELSKV